jgi:CubicO group peptidase (beta-lactamase class C family)
MWLIKVGDGQWNAPITSFIPELAQSNPQILDYPTPDWNDITINDLATYLAGFIRDYGLNDISILDSVTAELPKIEATFTNDTVPGRMDPVCGYLTANSSYDECPTDCT